MSRSSARAWEAAWPVAAVGLTLAAGWALAARFSVALPGPAEVASELGAMAADGRLASIVWRVGAFMGVCFVVAAAIGVAIGLAVASRPLLDRGLSPYFSALQAMPTSLWIPVAAIVAGSGTVSLGVVVTAGAVPAIALATRTAIHGVPPLLLRAARTLGESGPSLARRVVLPAAAPGILGGLEVGWSIAFRCLVAGELFGGAASGTGIGNIVERSRDSGSLVEMSAAIVIVLAFSVLVDRVVFARSRRRLAASRGLGEPVAAL